MVWYGIVHRYITCYSIATRRHILWWPKHSLEDQLAAVSERRVPDLHGVVLTSIVKVLIVLVVEEVVVVEEEVVIVVVVVLLLLLLAVVVRRRPGSSERGSSGAPCLRGGHVLYYTMIYYSMLYCTLLYYTAIWLLYYAILYYTILESADFGRRTAVGCDEGGGSREGPATGGAGYVYIYIYMCMISSMSNT